MPDDPVAAALAEAKRIADGLHFACRLPDKVPDFTACGGPAAEAYWEYFTPARISSFLAAVEAALKLHARQNKPVRSWDQPCDAHLKAIGTLRLGDRPGAFGAIRDCPDCRYTEYYVCSHCTCPNDTWPCPTVEAIRTALLGEEAGDGG